MKASYIYIFIVKQQLNLLLSSRPEGEILSYRGIRSLPLVDDSNKNDFTNQGL